MGKIVRSANLFDDAWAKDRRARHLIARLAFTHALWSRALPPALALYRAMASDAVLDPRARSSFVSATFSREVAMEHFQRACSTQTAAILRQPTPAGRLLMSFLETPAMSRRYREAEAVLIGDPGNPIF